MIESPNKEPAMKAYVVALGAMLATAAPVAARTQSCAAVTPAQIESLFDRWNASLGTLDPDAVVRNYAPDAVLLPTVSNKPRLTQEERRDYFVHFLENHPVGKIDQRTIRIGCNDAIDTGLYTFTFANGQVVHARYTFTYALKGGKWLISSHHSSMMPETNPASH